MILPGLVDLHVHTMPDLRRRSCDDFGLAREAKRVGARAVVIKSHHMLTADRALLARSVVPGVPVFGGIALNPSVGGLNPAAVDVALRLGGKIVWLPTLFAEQHLRFYGKTGGVVVVENGRIVDAAVEVFRQIAVANAILATGHQSADEIPVIVAEAWAQGVRKILINHPEHHVVAMSIEAQRELRREFPVHFERCHAQPSPAQNGVYLSNYEANLRAIEALGVDSTIIASDGGQIETPPWAVAWEQAIEFYLRHGITAGDLRRMAADVPARLLDLEGTVEVAGSGERPGSTEPPAKTRPGPQRQITS